MGAVKWIVEALVLIILSSVVFTVIASTLDPIIANATGIQAVVLPLVAPFVALGVALIIIFGALRAAKVGGGAM
jgi:hypothetical protein